MVWVLYLNLFYWWNECSLFSHQFPNPIILIQLQPLLATFTTFSRPSPGTCLSLCSQVYLIFNEGSIERIHVYKCNKEWSNLNNLVWKIFCIILWGDSRAPSSNRFSSSWVRRQPRAPKFSCACFNVLAPGMGMVPLEMHQFIATCYQPESCDMCRPKLII